MSSDEANLADGWRGGALLISLFACPPPPQATKLRSEPAFRPAAARKSREMNFGESVWAGVM